jgi:hypothetical protein
LRHRERYFPQEQGNDFSDTYQPLPGEYLYAGTREQFRTFEIDASLTVKSLVNVNESLFVDEHIGKDTIRLFRKQAFNNTQQQEGRGSATFRTDNRGGGCK